MLAASLLTLLAASPALVSPAPQGFESEAGLNLQTWSAAAFADFDGDGSSDLLFGRSKLFWSSNDGAGGFYEVRSVDPSVATGIGSFETIAADDLDLDGDTDIFGVRRTLASTDVLGWHANRGSGSFGSFVELRSINMRSREGHIADLDGDGDSDALVLTQDRRLVWFEQLGSGSVAFGPERPLTPLGWNVRGVRIGDVDRDGDRDLVVLRVAGGAPSPVDILLYANEGGGAFSAPSVTVTTADPLDSFDLADMDLDGDLDVVLPSVGTNRIDWYENAGTGAFPTPHAVATLGVTPSGVVAADFDGDGDVDVASGGFFPTGSVLWYERLGGGGFAPGAVLSTTARVTSDVDLGMADINGDGVEDLWMNDDTVEWVDASGASAQWAAVPVGHAFRSDSGGTATDFDQDGDIDVALGDESGFWLLENSGDGLFRERRQIEFGIPGVSAPLAVDVDGDGDEDLVYVAGAFLNHSLELCLNLGGGAFAPRVSLYSTGVFDVPIASAGDVDADGDVDLLVGLDPFGLVGGESLWLLNDGAGVFTEQPIFPGMFRQAEVVDLDGDGDAEALEMRFTPPSTCSILLHSFSPAGALSATQSIASFTGCQGRETVVSGDIDGDGLLDLVAHDPSQGAAVGFFGQAGGGLGPEQALISGASAALGYAVADVNLDGVNDLLGFAEEAAQWYSGLGGATFGPARSLDHGVYSFAASAVQTVDFDADGDLDLLKTASGPVVQRNTARAGFGTCAANELNSAGALADMWIEGSTTLLVGAPTLRAAGLPSNQFGIFLVADGRGAVVHPGGSLGTLCLGGAIGRFSRPGEILSSGTAGTAELDIDVSNVPTPSGSEALMPGDTRYFQFWYRDSGVGSPANLTGAVGVRFR